MSLSLNEKSGFDLIPFKNNTLLFHVRSWMKRQTAFSICVLLPLFIIGSYLLFIKTPEYESSTSILIHNYGDDSGMQEKANSLFQKARDKQQSQVPSSATVSLIKHYLSSDELLFALENTAGIKAHYQAKSIDSLSRLKKTANKKEFLDYFNKKIKVSANSNTGEINIALRAFSPEKAQEVLHLMGKQSIEFVNKIELSAAKEQKMYLQSELHKSREKLLKAKLQFKNLTQDPTVHPQELAHRQLKLKFVEAEYDAAQQAYVFWIMSLKRNSAIQILSPTQPDSYSYPRLPYDLFSLLVIFSIFFILVKMIIMLIGEHIY
jgi:capsule polysaccharide export protein KpsE/RkpR